MFDLEADSAFACAEGSCAAGAKGGRVGSCILNLQIDCEQVKSIIYKPEGQNGAAKDFSLPRNSDMCAKHTRGKGKKYLTTV